ncbi:MAG: hypothetical protein HY721_03130 [Planctomycetes bacterium]|nr:hypothetical protein [Planctomycetota bacterium]
MRSARARRRLWIVAAAGIAAACVLGAAVVGYWDVILTHYRAHRLEEARTFEEAAPWLDELLSGAARPPAARSFLETLGAARPWRTFWFFARVADGASEKSPLVEAFAGRLPRDERLLAAWSHFVRWQRGPGLWAELDAMSPHMAEVPESGFRCATFVQSGDFVVRVGQAGGTSTGSFPGGGSSFLPLLSTATVDFGSLSSSLEAVGIAWFLGLSPVPRPSEEPRKALEAWLGRFRPFLLDTTYDPARGRCKREGEEDPAPTSKAFAERDLPVPDVPLPGWKGPVPAWPGQQQTLLLPGRTQWILNQGFQQGELIDSAIEPEGLPGIEPVETDK